MLSAAFRRYMLIQNSIMPLKDGQILVFAHTILYESLFLFPRYILSQTCLRHSLTYSVKDKSKHMLSWFQFRDYWANLQDKGGFEL